MNFTDKQLAKCQRVIGYFFADAALLGTAMTHSSLRSPDRECNERLEFLGDSVLGLVITEELYRQLPDSAEGEMTRIKSAVVSRSALFSASRRLGLAEFADYARGVGSKDDLPTSVVANLVESVIGAIYIDAGYYPAREFVLRHLGSEIEDVLNDRGVKNYKSLLQHDVQQAVSATPHYRTVEEDGPDHDKVFVVAAVVQGREWGRASGANKKEAEQEAARLALEAWSRRGRGRRRRRGSDPEAAGAAAQDRSEGDAPAEVAGSPRRSRKRQRRRGAAAEAPPAEAAPAVSDAETPSRMAPSSRTARRPARKDGSAPVPVVTVEPVEPAAPEAVRSEPAPAAVDSPQSAASETARTKRPARRRRRREEGVEPAPVERASSETDPQREEQDARPEPSTAPRPEARPVAPPTSTEEAAPADSGRRMLKRRRRARDAQAPAASGGTPDTRAPEGVPADGAPVAASSKPAATPAPVPEPERELVSEADFGAGIVGDTDAAPSKPAPVRQKKAALRKRAATQPAKKAPDRNPAPKPTGGGDGFASGILGGDGDGPAEVPPKPVRKKTAVARKKKAARKAAPRKPTSAKEAGFGAGIVDDGDTQAPPKPAKKKRAAPARKAPARVKAPKPPPVTDSDDFLSGF